VAEQLDEARWKGSETSGMKAQEALRRNSTPYSAAKHHSR
jgi:hypothetical protein